MTETTPSKPTPAAKPLPDRPAAKPKPKEPTLEEVRFARVDEYQQKALKVSNPLRAILGSVNSDLCKVGFHVAHTVIEAAKQIDRSTDRLHQLTPNIDVQLRVARQVERFAQLELRLEENTDES